MVAPEIVRELMERAAAGNADSTSGNSCRSDLDGARLVIVATSHRAVNRWIANLSESRNIPVNVVDDREASRFIVPAIIDRDPVLVAVSTGGTSPVLARRLRERLEALIPARIGELAAWLEALRASDAAQAARHRRAAPIFRGHRGRSGGAALHRGRRSGCRAHRAAAADDERRARRAAAGEVTLVGAGPGDPELLTLKALRALQDADVILHDRLVSAEVLDLARRDAERICVGKAAGRLGSTQEEINALLIEHAKQGKRVVRLKGGDPFVFGRGGEELQALAGGTDRFLRGTRHHRRPRGGRLCGNSADASRLCARRDLRRPATRRAMARPEPDWRALASPGTTAVFYMGLARLDHIVAKLLEHGAAASRPAGSSRRDRRRTNGSSRRPWHASRAVARGHLESPALLIVGDVAALHSSLAWFVPGGVDLSQTA